MVFGFLIGGFGIIYGTIRKIPGLEEKIEEFLKMIKNSYKIYFKRR
jgi:hypothetical protein